MKSCVIITAVFARLAVFLLVLVLCLWAANCMANPPAVVIQSAPVQYAPPQCYPQSALGFYAANGLLQYAPVQRQAFFAPAPLPYFDRGLLPLQSPYYFPSSTIRFIGGRSILIVP